MSGDKSKHSTDDTPYQVRYGTRIHHNHCVDAYRAVGLNRDVRGQAANDVRLANAGKGLLAACERALAHWEQLGHDAVCNGVHAPDGQCEGSHWAAQTEDMLRDAIKQAKP